MASSASFRVKILETITAPLGFFVLALLIVETFLSTILVGAKIIESQKMNCVWMGVAMFIYVTLMVFILVWFKPQNENRRNH